MRLVRLDTHRITDWNTFHEVFAAAFGFPTFYGRNMDAWIDCMTYLGQPASGMTMIGVSEGQVVVLQLEAVAGFAARCPDQHAAIIECSAFVNWRRIERGQGPVLALSFFRT